VVHLESIDVRAPEIYANFEEQAQILGVVLRLAYTTDFQTQILGLRLVLVRPDVTHCKNRDFAELGAIWQK
jgi:hypothetical protein